MIDVPPSSLFSVLLVEPDHVDRVLAHSAMAGVGFHVTATNNYDDALAIVESHPPMVLVSALRLGNNTGVELALRAKARRSGIAVVLTSSMPDPVRQRDAEGVGATFVLKPVTPDDLLAATWRTAMRQYDGADDPIRPPFERRRGDRRLHRLATVPDERRRAARRRDIASVLLGIPAAV